MTATVEYPYVPAHLISIRHGGVHPALIVLHDMEAPEKGNTAETCAQFFQRLNSTGSAHLCIDNDSIVQCVPYENAAAGARGCCFRQRTVNDYGIHIEHAGYANQTAADWSDPYSQAMLFWSSIAAAKIAKRYSIPAVALDETAIRQGNAGIVTHAVVSRAFNVHGGHTDPGPNFPLSTYVGAVASWLPHV